MRDGILVQPLDGPVEERVPKHLVTESSAGQTFSPDGRWIVYRTPDGIFVQPLPGPGLRQQISAISGREPRWRRDGREIVFTDGLSSVYSIPVETVDNDLQFGEPELLFSGARVPSGANVSRR